MLELKAITAFFVGYGQFDASTYFVLKYQRNLNFGPRVEIVVRSDLNYFRQFATSLTYCENEGRYFNHGKNNKGLNFESATLP